MIRRITETKMFKRISVALVGGIFAASIIYFAVVGVGSFSKSSPSTPHVSTTASSEIIPSFDVGASPVLQIQTSSFQNLPIPLSPVLWSQLVDGYVAAQDVQSGMFGNVRYESVGTTDNFKSTERKFPHTFMVSIGEKQISFPEMPTSISASVYYTHASGILPLTSVFNWENLSSKQYEEWEKAFLDANFERINEVILENNSENNYVVKAVSFESPDKYTGEIVYRENVKVGSGNNNPIKKDVTQVSLFVITEAENLVKDYLNKINTNAVNFIVSKGSMANILEWRRPCVIADYRFVDSSRVYGIDFATLNDRTLLNTNVPVYTTTYESWGGIPIGWSWLMYKNDWDTVKEQVIFDLVGRKNVSDSDLIDGIRSSNDLFLRSELLTVTNGNDPMIKISIVDKQVDNMVSTIFDHFNIVDVQGLRNRQAGEIRTRRNQLENQKNQANTKTETSGEISAPTKQDIQ